MSSGEPGHFVVRHGAGDWRCACGTSLSGGPLGPARKGARDVMHFHQLDLQAAKRTPERFRGPTLSELHPGEMLSVRVVRLTQGQFAIIDPEDAELVSSRVWFASKPRSATTYYADSKLKRGRTSMHKLITGFRQTDHANRNGLDNRRCNLREATHQQNQANKALLSNNTSGYKGVKWHGGKWEANITISGQRVRLGRYDNPEQAAHAYDEAAIAAWGEFAVPNLGRAS